MSIIIEPLRNGKTVMRYMGKSKAEISNFYKKLKTCQNDTNIACDKFFRQDELYDRQKDIVHSGYRKYSIDDIPADESLTVFNKDKVHLFSRLKSFIESKHKPYIILHKDKTQFPLDKIYEPGAGRYSNYMIECKLDEGYTLEQVLNVYYSGIINEKIRHNLTNSAFKMIKAGYPTEYVVKLMERSKLRKANGQQKYSEGMLEFLEKFPYMRKYMVSQSSQGEEFFDSVGANYYPKIFNSSKNEIEALRILKHCRIKHKDNTFSTDEHLVICALELLKHNNGDLSKYDYQLMKNLASVDHVHVARVKAVYPKICEGIDSKIILKEYLNPLYFTKNRK